MKTITISTENSETYSSISNFFIDYYMAEANGEFVKVYLYLVRLLSDNKSVTVAGIADHFNLTENDICRAIKYWITRDVLKLSYDGRGRLNGIILLPLKAPFLATKLETDAVSILRDASYEADNHDDANISHKDNEEADEKLDSGTMLTAPLKPSFSKSYISQVKDPDFENIIYTVETIFDKPISASDTNTLLYIYDTLKFDVGLIEFLVDYCVKMDKKNCRYMEAVAIAWYKDGITTRQQAKEQVTLTSGIIGIVFKTLGISRTNPTSAEIAYINTWNKDFGFSPEIIKLACERAILARPNSANFKYINGILESWHKNNVQTVSDIEKLDEAFAAKRSAEAEKKRMAKVSSFSDFKQAKLDDELDEMENLFLKEVNNK